MEILQEKNIYTNCMTVSKEEVIRKLGSILVKDGYVEPQYVESMLEKEKVFNTSIGNMVAIPHCTEEGRKLVNESGIDIMIFPDGINWGNDMIKIAIGIAGKADEHVDILMKIATVLSEKSEAEKMLTDDAHTIYNK